MESVELADGTFRKFCYILYDYYYDDFGPDPKTVYDELLKSWLINYMDVTTA